MLDLDQMLSTMSKVSGDRVLPVAQTRKEADLCFATIPVAMENPGDKNEVALRRYAKDWIKKQGEFSVEARFQRLKNQSWYDDEGNETPLYGVIELTWWEKPPMTDFELLMATQKANRKFRT